MKQFMIVCLFFLSAYAHAALNKWVDAEGQIHYSDAPPGNTNSQTLSVPAAASGVPRQKSVAEQEADWRKKQKADEDAAQKDAKQNEKEQARQENCSKLRANLATLEIGGRIVSYNEKGEAVFMDDEMKKKNISETRQRISETCN